jgi:hypothetical protein
MHWQNTNEAYGIAFDVIGIDDPTSISIDWGDATFSENGDTASFAHSYQPGYSGDLHIFIGGDETAFRVVVAEGDEMTGAASTTYSGAYDVIHSDFYINSGTGWGVSNLETNISSTTSHTPAWVTIFVSQDLSGAASTAAPVRRISPVSPRGKRCSKEDEDP